MLESLQQLRFLCPRGFQETWLCPVGRQDLGCFRTIYVCLLYQPGTAIDNFNELR